MKPPQKALRTTSTPHPQVQMGSHLVNLVIKPVCIHCGLFTKPQTLVFLELVKREASRKHGWASRAASCLQKTSLGECVAFLSAVCG